MLLVMFTYNNLLITAYPDPVGTYLMISHLLYDLCLRSIWYTINSTAGKVYT